ncbi:MAG: SurA N-terminal domain-containing protein [Pseudomonadota bacterium]
MLSFMREKAGSWFIKVILFAIVVVFVLWGVGSFNESRRNEVASVNGEPIEQDEYRQAYNNYIENLRRQFRDNLTPEIIEKLQVKQQVVNGLVTQKLMLQEAKKLNLRVSDEELVETIQGIEAFKTAGSFDNNRYKAIMNQIRMTPEVFEERHRQDMLIDKLKSMINNGIHVSEGEARQWYEFNNATVNIAFALFSPEAYKNIEPGDEDLKAFFDENKASYKTETMVKIRYLQFEPEKFKEKVTMEPADISDYYESFAEEFRTEKTVEARHILLKLAPSSPEATVESVRQKALTILKEARDGNDFAELAKKHSDDSSKNQGGLLGTFKRGAMVKPFSDKAFSMEAGEISDPVRTEFGWHIIKVEKVNEASFLSLEEATQNIREKLVEKKARELAFAAAESAYDIVFADGTLEKIAATLKMDLKTTDFFKKNDNPLNIAEASKVASAAFELDDKAISTVLELKEGYVVLQRIETDPEKIPELAAVQSAVRSDLIKRKQAEKAKSDAEAFLSALKAGTPMDAEAEKYGIKPVRTGFFKRGAVIPQLGNEREIARVAFELYKDKPLPESVLQGTKGAYVIQFVERNAPSPDGFAAEKKKIEEQLMTQKEQAYFSQWIEKVRANSKIVIGESYRN